MSREMLLPAHWLDNEVLSAHRYDLILVQGELERRTLARVHNILHKARYDRILLNVGDNPETQLDEDMIVEVATALSLRFPGLLEARPEPDEDDD